MKGAARIKTRRRSGRKSAASKASKKRSAPNRVIAAKMGRRGDTLGSWVAELTLRKETNRRGETLADWVVDAS